MHLSFQALVLAALSLEGVLSQPAHRHQHKHRRDLADVLGEKLEKRVDFNNPALYANVNWEEACKNGACDGGSPQPAAVEHVASGASSAGASPAGASTPTFPSVSAAIVPTTSATSAASAASSSSSSTSSTGSTGNTGSNTGSCSSLASVWDKSSSDNSRTGKVFNSPNPNPCNGGCTSADGQPFYKFDDTSTAASAATKDAYKGNVGTTYGHNMFPITNCDVKDHDYSITFTNDGSSQIEIAMWNKNGDDGQALSGASRNAFWKFPLEVGQSAAFAVAPNTQMAFSKACTRNSIGDYGCVWGEGDFANEENGGWSGYDRSSIQSLTGNTGLLTMCVVGHDCSSQQTHSFVSDKQTDAGGNLSLDPNIKQVNMQVSIG